MKIIFKIFILASSLIFISASAQPIPRPMTGLEKIDEALEKKIITEADAAGLKVLSFFSSPALPSQFRSDHGAQAGRQGDTFLNDARDFLPQMSELIAEQVYYYMIPPPFRPEEVNKDNDNFPSPQKVPNRLWTYTESEAANVRVWFLKDNFQEERLAALILGSLSNDIIPAEENLMGRRHGTDNVEERGLEVRQGKTVSWPHGGDGKLDVYLFDFPPPPPDEEMPYAWTQSYPTNFNPNIGCPKSPTYIAVNLLWAKNAAMSELSSIMAHEYFHVLQSSYDMKGHCRFYRNMAEGTASYVMHYVYPKANDEHQWFRFSENGRLSMLTENYATWPFYLYMTQMQGVGSLRTLIETWAEHNAFEALNKTLEGGLKKHWPDFAVHSWNQGPLTDSFLQWDNYVAVPGRGQPDAQGHLPAIEPEKVVLDENGHYRYDMNMFLQPMTRDVYAFDVSGEDVRSIAIDNPVFGNADKMHVKLLGRRKGQSNFEEILWEDNSRKEYLYCLDKKDQNYDLLVIVAANYQHTRTGDVLTPSPSFKATNQGCHSFKGTVNWRMEMPNNGNKFVLEIEVKDFTVLETGRFDDSDLKSKFLIIDGSVNYKTSGKMGDCEANAFGSLTLQKGPKAKGLELSSFLIDPLRWGTYTIIVKLVEQGVTVPFTCPGGRTFTRFFPAGVGTVFQPYPHHGGKPDLIGEASNFGFSINWNLKPVEE